MYSSFIKAVSGSIAIVIVALGVVAGDVDAAEDEVAAEAFPDKYMLRLGVYVVDGSKTQFSINSNVAGLGTTIDYQRDMGGESGDTIPRIDAYYRFNDRHRIDFTSFSIDRKGTRTLAIDLTIEGQDYLIGETVNSDIKYTLYKVGYGYSFYHSEKVELSLSAGLNITSYDLSFSSDSGNFESAGVSVPLPVFGLRVGYAITPKWSIHYLTEAFFIEYEDKFRGSLQNYELTTEYRLFKNFAIGGGFARLGIDVDVNSDDWKGSVTDGYNGYNLFGTLYF